MEKTRIAKILMVAMLTLAAQLPTGIAAGGPLPDEQTCRNEAVLAEADDVTQGACIALHRRKGYCNACHVIAGVSSGNIAPALTNISQRFPDRARLRAHIEDPRQHNPDSVMPPFGAHRILTAEEIDKVVEFLLAL